MKKKIVIFGSDNTGKTTLQDNLKQLILSSGNECDALHSPGPISTEKQIEFMEENLNKDIVTIFDRFPVIEETVCGRVLRGHSNFDSIPETRDKFLSDIDLFIFCYPGLSTITNWGEREQMEGVKDNILDLSLGYFTLFTEFIKKGYNVKEYNFKTDDIEELLKGVI